MTAISIRQWHSYIGLFTAPSILFFSLTGAVQLFSLHEAHGSYRPPALVEELSSVHKDQVFASGGHHPDDDGRGKEGPPAADARDDKSDVPALVLKAFFLLVAMSLSLSTAFGLWMGLTQPRRRKASWWLIAAGTVIPLGLILF